MCRNVAFDFRGKRDSPEWKAWWDRAIFFGSLVPAVLWGVAFGNIVRGVAIDSSMEFTGSFFDLLNPFALLGGVVTLGLFVTHGAVYLSLKTTDDVRVRARALAFRVGIVATVAALAFLGWTWHLRRHAEHVGWFVVLAALAAVALVAALVAIRAGREGWAFLGTAVTIALATAALFTSLFPEVMPSTTDAAYSLTTTNASSTPKTLRLMSWIAVVCTPFVVGYQAWTYVVFRRRIGVRNIPGA
ncbi:MAG: cytochrome d ubiquinol oxidase subunit II [Ilumatobacteraceae bacterium]